jgi:hypothetical protein
MCFTNNKLGHSCFDVKLKHCVFQVEKFKDTLACLMITYPSTNGVFDKTIRYVETTCSLQYFLHTNSTYNLILILAAATVITLCISVVSFHSFNHTYALQMMEECRFGIICLAAYLSICLPELHLGDNSKVMGVSA